MERLFNPNTYDLMAFAVEADRRVVEDLVPLSPNLNLTNLLSFLNVEGEDHLLGSPEELQNCQKAPRGAGVTLDGPIGTGSPGESRAG